jgi:hypothetical protein
MYTSGMLLDNKKFLVVLRTADGKILRQWSLKDEVVDEFIINLKKDLHEYSAIFAEEKLPLSIVKFQQVTG